MLTWARRLLAALRRPPKAGPTSGSGATHRVWRMSEQSPSGVWVETQPSSMRPPAEPPRREASSTGWHASSMDLLTGIEVVEKIDGPDKPKPEVKKRSV